MATVGYLLGAGASAQCIPVVNGMSNDLRVIVGQLYGYFMQSGEYGEMFLPNGAIGVKKAGNALTKLSEICENHYSVDTYAKKLFLTNINAFEKLKLDLSLYFTLRQIITNSDKRYDNFFSSIITSENKLPSQIKIISWNYDFQLEKSYCQFNPQIDINMARALLGITGIATIKWTFS